MIHFGNRTYQEYTVEIFNRIIKKVIAHILQHSYCPEGPDSWCAYQKHQFENNDTSFEHPPTFDQDIATILKPKKKNYPLTIFWKDVWAKIHKTITKVLTTVYGILLQSIF